MSDVPIIVAIATAPIGRYWDEESPRAVAEALGIDPDMTVAELQRRLAIAERALACETLGSPFVKHGSSVLSQSTQRADELLHVIVNGDDQ